MFNARDFDITGQWFGRYENLIINENILNDLLLLNLEHYGEQIKGTLRVIPQMGSQGLPLRIGITIDKVHHNVSNSRYNFEGKLCDFILSENGLTYSNSLQVQIPSCGTFKAALHSNQEEGDSIHANWATDQYGFDNSVGPALFSRPVGRIKTPLVSKEIAWKDAKNIFSSIDHNRYLLRGQNKPFTLRTAFHRKRRFNISSLEIEVDEAIAYLNGPSERNFYQKLMFLRHYGYAVPVLDWTSNWMVAVYFSMSLDDDNQPRIFVLNRANWMSKFQTVDYPRLLDEYPMFFLVRGDFVDNKRLLNQAAWSSYSSIDDIGEFLTFLQSDQKIQLLESYDIKINSRREKAEILNELLNNGISASMLFEDSKDMDAKTAEEIAFIKRNL
jgi:hypothetical protein